MHIYMYITSYIYMKFNNHTATKEAKKIPVPGHIRINCITHGSLRCLGESQEESTERRESYCTYHSKLLYHSKSYCLVTSPFLF